MVQLKLAHDIYKRYPSEFQFHNGTIKTHHVRAVLQLLFYFNSIMVQLKLKVHLNLLYIIIYFNSIMVQLKTVIKYAVEIKRNKFQFHNGTIKTKDKRPFRHRLLDISIP